MNIDKDAVLKTFEYILLEEVNYEGLPQEWLDIRKDMVPVINEAFLCGCAFIEKKILERDEFDFIGKKGEYSKIQVKHFYGSLSPLFEELLPIWDTWLEFDPTDYNPKLFKGSMVINSKDCSLNLIIELPEKRAIEITMKNQGSENCIEACSMLYYDDSWKEDRIFCDLKHGIGDKKENASL